MTARREDDKLLNLIRHKVVVACWRAKRSAVALYSSSMKFRRSLRVPFSVAGRFTPPHWEAVVQLFSNLQADSPACDLLIFAFSVSQSTCTTQVLTSPATMFPFTSACVSTRERSVEHN